jgi:hypothetical protein
MARTMSVKVPTATLIANIEASIAKIDVDVAEYAEKRKQYELEVKKYNDEAITYIEKI